MADVRALLAAERQSRRISHPYLTYSKSGALSCNICNLNIRSEQLWPGHLKSANHRKNAEKAQELSSKPLKRKLDDYEDAAEENFTKPLKRKLDDYDATGEDGRHYEVDNRKKPKSQVPLTPVSEEESVVENAETESVAASGTLQDHRDTSANERPVAASAPADEEIVTADVTAASETVDEDEWAAFERDVAPLAQPDYSAATITAAPVTAAELAAQDEAEKRKRREDEAEDEKEDEGRRMEEEFDVMEEMEDRLRRLREKRENLRTMLPVADVGQQELSKEDLGDPSSLPKDTSVDNDKSDENNDDDSDDDVDDWYA